LREIIDKRKRQKIDKHFYYYLNYNMSSKITNAIYNRDDALLLELIEQANTNVTLKKQLSKQQKTNNSSTFLHLSISVNNSNALKILLENKLGGDIIMEDAQGRMPLHLAIEKQSYECVHILCKHIVKHKPKWLSLILKKTDSKNNLPIFHACRQPKILKELIESIYSTMSDDDNINIIEKQNSIVGETLGIMEKQIPSGNTALHIASMCGLKESCKMLLTISNSSNNNNINNNASSQHQQFVNILNNNNETSLMVACKEGHMEVVEYLCNNIQDINELNIQNKDGDTALHLCFMMGHEAIGHYLINKGSKQNIKNNENKLPYDYQELLLLSNDNNNMEDDELDESLVSIVRNLPIVDLNLNNRKTSKYAVVDDAKLNAKQYLEKYILSDLQESLVALLKRHEKLEEKKLNAPFENYKPVEINPCHFIASYLLRHKKGDGEEE